MKHVSGKSLLLVAAATLLGAATVANAQVRTNPTIKAPTVRAPGVIISNGVAKPDLAVGYHYQVPCMGGNCALPPVSHMPSTGFCGPWSGGNQQLRLMVANVGTVQTAPTQVKISYLYAGAGLSTTMNMIGLAAGQNQVMVFDVPAGAWSQSDHPMLHYTIQVDSGSVLDESNENNNSATSLCMGPAG